MANRIRVRQVPFTGNRTTDGGSVTYRSYLSLDERTEDVTGLGDNQPFSVARVEKSGGLANGKSKHAGYNLTWNSCPVDYQRLDPWAETHLSLSPTDEGNYATQLLKRTNPSRASMQALVSGIELREVPPLIRDLWNIRNDKLFQKVPRKVFRSLKLGARLNLMIQFGIMPLIGDVNTLLNLQPLVDQRVKEIDRLMTRGLRRTVSLDTMTKRSQTSLQSVHSSPITLKAKLRKFTEQEVRGHVRWHVHENFYLSDKQRRAKALNIIIGNKLDPLTMWEAMPWSWFIDYFTNLGDFISSTRNSLHTTHSIPRIMYHKTTRFTSYQHTYYHSSSTGWEVHFSPMSNVIENKSRNIVPASLAAFTEFLSGSQLSIVGSLYVTKFLR
nr:MAG: hypothetical protein 1 [Leviviridae sp.]